MVGDETYIATYGPAKPNSASQAASSNTQVANTSTATRPFVDGNKRAAFLSIGLFLTINGYRLTASQVDAVETMLSVAGGTKTEEALAIWIVQNSKER
jgi:death-on-curing protein